MYICSPTLDVTVAAAARRRGSNALYLRRRIEGRGRRHRGGLARQVRGAATAG
jgi:hypothetical protein